MAKKTMKVSLVQNRDGAVKKIRVDGHEIEVLSAMPTLVNGQLAVAVTLVGVDLSAEVDGGEKETDR